MLAATLQLGSIELLDTEGNLNRYVEGTMTSCRLQHDREALL